MKKTIINSAAVLALSISAQSLQAQEFDINMFKTQLKDTPHNVKLINSGLASLEERLQMIERAKTSIDIEYFIYNSDKSGKIFTQALIKKAREGVKIRMLLDTVMIKGLITPFYVHEFKDAGVEVKYFNNTAKLNLVKGMYRNHRKLLIVDGQEIITGGRNIGDEYFDLREDFNFLDREFLIEGPIVKTIKDSFEVLWNSKLSEFVDRDKMPEKSDFKYRQNSGRGSNDNISQYYADLKFWKKGAEVAHNFFYEEDKLLLSDIRAKGAELLQESYKGICNNISFTSEYPIANKSNRDVRIIKHTISERISTAKEKVLLDSPYFIVDEDSKAALDRAFDNHVKVELLTNGLNSTDAIYVFDVFKTIVKKWIDKGLVAFTFKGEKPEYYSVLNDEIAHARFGVHAKTFVFDNKDVIVGTYNFDPRSANYNAEMIISCDNNEEMAKEVTADIEKRMESSFKLDTKEKVDENSFYKISFFKKLVYGVLKIPANVFDYLL